MTRRRRPAIACTTLVALAACQPTLDDPRHLLTATRVLAIASEPAEAVPGAPVRLRALVAGPTGVTPDDEVRWSFCRRGRPVAESRPVDEACLEARASWLAPIAVAPSSRAVSATLPVDGCAVFGSTPPAPAPGEAPRRPADPDATGGYFQPVRALLAAPAFIAVGSVRLRCPLSSAPAAVARAFTARYVANNNPEPGALQALPLGGDARGRVALTLSWRPDDAERYLVYDLAGGALVERRETLTVSWFSTTGAFDRARTTARAGEVRADTVWRAAARTGASVTLVAVLRDDRGGVAWRSVRVVDPG